MPETEGAWPFDNWMKIAVFRLGWTPQQFWNCALKDWIILMRATPQPMLTRADFEALNAKFPDIIDEDISK